MSRPLQGLILAAGASNRMGQPKANLKLNQMTCLEVIVRQLATVCQQVTIVSGAHFETIRKMHPHLNIVRSRSWRRGMRASLRDGVRSIPKGDILLTHCDRPGVEQGTIDRLINTHGFRPRVPMYRGLGGHPVWIPEWLRPRLLEDDGAPLRTVLRNANFESVFAPDLGIQCNLNHRQDWFRFRAEQRKCFGSLASNE